MWTPLRLQLLLLLLAGCSYGPYLKAAPEAQHLPGHPDTAVVEANGVRVIVTGQRWYGDPADLAALVTPVDIAVENHSGFPLGIRYRRFVLINEAGLQVASIPPYHIQRPGLPVAVSPYYPSVGFYVGGPYVPYYPGIPPWPGPFDYDPAWYYGGYAYWQPALPTPDMLRKALPEGVLGDGGHVRGYLYFPRVNAPNRQVKLHFELVNAQSRQPFGVITLPLLVTN